MFLYFHWNYKMFFFFLFTVITKIPFNYVPKVQFVGTGLFCLQLTVLVSVRVSEERLPGVVFSRVKLS